MTNNNTIIGIDIAKAKFDVALDEKTNLTLPNNQKGCEQLIEHCKKLHEPHVLLEATGGYENLPVKTLRKAGIKVTILNPRRVRSFIIAEGINAKTDRIDAQMIRKFGLSHKVCPQHVPTENEAKLRALCEVRSDLVEMRKRVSQRLEKLNERTDKFKIGLLARQRDWFDKEICRLEKLITGTVESDADLKVKVERMTQVKGVGPVLSATLLAFVPELGAIEDNKLSSLIGVAPHPQDSGTRVKKGHIHYGRARVRRVLYMSGVCCIRFNPHLSKFYQRLRNQSGKPFFVAIVATMRKLLCLLNRLIKDPDFQLS